MQQLIQPRVLAGAGDAVSAAIHGEVIALLANGCGLTCAFPASEHGFCYFFSQPKYKNTTNNTNCTTALAPSRRGVMV